MLVVIKLLFEYFCVDWDEVVVVIMLCMWMIIVNMLYNLIVMVFFVDDFECFVWFMCDMGIVVLFDEVYEYVVFDGV